MRRSFVGVATVVALVAGSRNGAWAQTTWYVDAAAIPPGLGTEAAPYASLQHAIARATTLAGDTVLVAPGIYAEQVTLTKQILVRAPSPRATFLVRPANASGSHVTIGPIDPDHESTARLEGFTITGTTGSSLAVNLQGGTLARCVVVGNSSIAVQSQFGTVQSCTIADNGTGILFATFGDTILADSIVFGNGTDVLGVGFGSARYTTYGTDPRGILPGTGPGNESADPLFADAGTARYLLRPGSPCIDSADPFLPHDADGSRADRGALPPLLRRTHVR